MAIPNKIHYQAETDEFLSTVRKRVNDHFNNSGKSIYANTGFYVKGFFLLTIYFGLYSYFLTASTTILTLLAYSFMGPIAILLGLNVAHDAAHGAVSSSKNLNNVLLLIFDLMGANSYIWKSRHVFSHHSFPNIIHQDADLKQSKLVRIFPNDEIQKSQKYQHLYMPVLYMLYTVNWLMVRDFQDFFRDRIGSLQLKHTKKEIIKLVLFKAAYLSYILVVPIVFTGFFWWQIVLAYFLMNALAGITITLALVPSHVASTSLFPVPDTEGVMSLSWSHHQLATTTDYATDSKVINWMMGGFNHHVTHHLFPKISHVHYRDITPIVKKTAEDFGLTYNYESSLLNAYLSHFKLIKNNGWNEWHKQQELGL